MSEATVITGVGITRYRLLAIESGLKLQAKTGMKSTGNRVPNAARYELLQAGIQPKRTIKALLEQFQAFRAKQDAELQTQQDAGN